MVEVSDLIEHTAAELRRLREDVEGESTGSSDQSLSNSSSSWDVNMGAVDDKREDEDTEVEDGKEVNQVEDPTLVPTIAPPTQVLAAEPIFVSSSGS